MSEMFFTPTTGMGRFRMFRAWSGSISWRMADRFALADFDRDGRLEVFLKNRNAPQLRILKNVMEELPGSIAFHLQGTKSNRDAIGASVTIETSAGRQTRIASSWIRISCRSTAKMFSLGLEMQRQ